MKFITRSLFLVAALSLLLLGGCRTSSPEELAREAVKREAQAAKKVAKNSLDQFGNLKATNSVLRGLDSHGRALWSVGASDIRVHDESTDSAGVVTPRTADLINARATLYRAGKPETTFIAGNIHLVYASAGPYMDMSQGVKMTTSGALVSAHSLAAPVTMETPKLRVDIKSRRLQSQSGVRLTQQKTTISTRRLDADTLKRVAQLSGNVKATSPDGDFSAKQATWNWADRRIVGQGEIVVHRADTTITGDRLDADLGDATGTLTGRVRATSPQGQAAAATVRYNWRAGSVVASGGVTLGNNDYSLRANNVQCDDKLDGAVAEGGVVLTHLDISVRAARVATFNKMARAVASGGVTVARAGDTARADGATVWLTEKRAVASGSVTLERAGMTLRADRVEAVNFGDRALLKVTADGRVSGRNAEGEARGDHMTWGAGQIVADGHVSLRRGQNILRGKRLQTDDKFQQARLTGDIGGALAGGGSISAGILLWQAGGSGGGKVLGRGGVHAQRGALRLRADNLEAGADGARATLSGHVVVVSEDGATLRAPHVRYDRAANKVYADGGVEFEDPARGLHQRGKTLVADLKLKEATLTDVSGGGTLNVLGNRKLF